MTQAFRRTATIILIAGLFGVAVAVLKGGSSGVRDALGNISAPWLVLPYLAGTFTRGWIRGAIMGTATCLAALLGFYMSEAFVLDLGGHPVMTNLALTLGAGRVYFAAGMLCGPVLGAMGGLPLKLRPVVTSLVVGLALAGEPFAVFTWLAHTGISPSDTGLVVQYPALWIGEMVLGLALCGGMLVRSASRARTG